MSVMRLKVCFNADPDPSHTLYFQTDHGPDPDAHSAPFIYINILLCKAAWLRIRIPQNDTLKIFLDPDMKTFAVSFLF